MYTWLCHFSRNYFLTASRWRPPRSGFFPVGESLNIINSIHCSMYTFSDNIQRSPANYAYTVWSGGPTPKLEDLQRTFCRRHNIQLPSLQKRFDHFTLALFFKVRIHQAPNSLYILFPPPSSSPGYTFQKISYPIPAVSRSSTLKSFLPRAIILWKALPVELQAMKSVHSFKRSHLKLIWFLKFLKFLFSFFSYTSCSLVCCITLKIIIIVFLCKPPPHPLTGT